MHATELGIGETSIATGGAFRSSAFTGRLGDRGPRGDQSVDLDGQRVHGVEQLVESGHLFFKHRGVT
jgi:hypothetical protein